LDNLQDIIQYLKIGVAFVGAGISHLLGGWDLALKVLVLFVVCDYITGLSAAWYEKKLDSSIGFFGIAKKVFLFIPIALAYWLDHVLGQDILRNVAIWFYLANEGLSILENLGRMEIIVPPSVVEALQQLKNREGTKKA